MTDAVSERFARFARDEAPGRSELYGEWAAGVAEDPVLQGILDRIPATHRQPPLVFAVTRILGAPLAGYASWRSFVLAHVEEIVTEAARRTLQTNEPLRLSALLPALSAIEGPMALLELGASAGLCLYPDRYSYRFRSPDGGVAAALDPVDGPSRVVLRSEVRGRMPALRMPWVVWRGGIDLAPLDAREPGDRAWIRALVWPEEEERAARIEGALDIAAADPPRLLAADVSEPGAIAALADSAPRDATLVITTPGVLVFLPRARRTALIEALLQGPGRWITIDAPGLYDGWRPPVAESGWHGSVVALDGTPLAAADPLGRWWEWRADRGSPST